MTKSRHHTKSRKNATPKRAIESGPQAPNQTAFEFHVDQLERKLITEESRSLLEDYFGPENYSELHQLACDTATRSVRGGPRVLILPGIMGSTLARRRFKIFEDVLWINPIEIAEGKLVDLTLNGGVSPYAAEGVILLAYLKLKLRLKIAGFDADFFPFDWRYSLSDLGARLAEAINKDRASQVSLVAHSMGGLVARAALKRAGDKVKRLVMLGTPNYGSFAPVQVIRATYDVVQKIGKLDLKHTPEQLSGQVFNTFPGLYEMLPAPEKFTAINLYDPAAWPRKGPQPVAKLLAAVKPVIDQLAPADSRFFLVAGVNHDTVTKVRIEGGEFAYEISPDGDGTVPLAFATLADIPPKQIYYVEESHGSLPNNNTVESAVVELLASGKTSVLPNERPVSRGVPRQVREKELKERAARAAGVGELGPADYRYVLDAVASPPKPERLVAAAAFSAATGAGTAAGAPSSGTSALLQGVTVGRRRQRRLGITLAHGSISDVDSPAYVLGVFRGVTPGGAASALDKRMNGAIAEFTARRMFSGDLGTVFMIPVGRNQLPADMILFAGLGAFDNFNAAVQQLVAENVIRVLVRSRVDEFATVLIGSGSGPEVPAAIQNLLSGFLRGLKDADPHQQFHSITLCESDAARFAQMKAELYRLAGTSLFDDVEITLDEMDVPPLERPSARVLTGTKQPVYLQVREETPSNHALLYRVSILGTDMKAAVFTGVKSVDVTKMDALTKKFDEGFVQGGKAQDVQAFGEEFADMFLPADACKLLQTMKDKEQSNHLVVVHDKPSARIPWETLTIDGWSPAVEGGLSRHYEAGNLPAATFLEQRRLSAKLKLLLIVNPLGDLEGAEKECKRIEDLAGTAIEVKTLRFHEASKAAILAALRSGAYDLVHYAGHAFFDPERPGQSGLICAGEEKLGSADLIGLTNLPALVFFNACEAGRLRGGNGLNGRRKQRPKAARQVSAPMRASTQIQEASGVAEALMRGGIANYISTYWPVDDTAADIFSETFYQRILAGDSIGNALLTGRKAIRDAKKRDWADYILYGNFDFALKQPSAA